MNFYIKLLFIISAISIILALKSIFYFFNVKVTKDSTIYPVWFSVLILLYFILPKNYNYFTS